VDFTSQGGADEIAELLAAAMEMGADGVEGQVEGEGDVFVAALLLVEEDEDGALGVGELEEGAVDGFEGLTVGELLLGVGGWGGEGFDEVGDFLVGIEGGGEGVGAVAAAALPLVLGYVEEDAVEVSGEFGVALEVRKTAVEAQEDLLGEVLDAVRGAGEALEGAEDHLLVLADDLLERELGRGAGLGVAGHWSVR
jgi:hypothetical protein